MSSTIRPPDHPEKPPLVHRRAGQGGQVLPLFAGGLLGFLAVAALVFDVGQDLLDWRAQRDAADGAALAGARYISDDTCEADPSLANCPDAVAAAYRVAALNGYGDLDGDGVEDRGHVEVHIPPVLADSLFRVPGFLEVTIHTDRPSFFAAVLGVLRQNVDALAVAGNSDDIATTFSMLALNEDCDPNPSGQVGGNGSTIVDGSVIVNADCEGALQVNGNGVLDAPDCEVGGTASENGLNADLACDTLVEGADGADDPLRYKDPGSMPGTPGPVEILKWNGGGTPKIPDGCPGSTIAITFVGAAYAAAETVAMPVFSGGDLALVFAYRNGSNSPPDLPTDWTDVASSDGANGNSRRLGYRWLDGSETTIGTWSNATAVEVIVLRGVDGTNPVGDHQSGGSAGSTLTTPGLSLTSTPAPSSWVVAFAGAADEANGVTDTLSSTTWRSGGVASLALHTGEKVTSWAQRDYGGSVVGPNRTDAVEILASPNPSTAANPVGCTLSGAGAGKYNVFRLHPGTYFGGIQLSGRRARVYLAPGTYRLAGGGLSVTGKDNQLVSVDGATSTTPGRGVFIYDTEDTGYCGVAPGNPCIGDISVNGGSTGPCTDPPQPNPYDSSSVPTQPCQWIHLEPTDSPVENVLIWVDRDFSGINVFFNGDAGRLELVGAIYDRWGEVKVNGGADDTVSSQVIAYTFKITGNGGFEVTYSDDGVVHLSGAGLVQ